METLIFCAFTEKSNIQGWGVHKKLIKSGGVPKKGALDSFQIQVEGGGGGKKEEGWCF